MGKKITPELKSQLERNLQSRQLIKVKINGEDYDIRVKQKISSEDKVKIFQIIAEVTEAEGYPDILAFTLAFVEVITDMALGNTLAERVALFLLLVDNDIVDTILNKISQDVIESYVDFLKSSVEILPEVLKGMEKDFDITQ